MAAILSSVPAGAFSFLSGAGAVNVAEGSGLI